MKKLIILLFTAVTTSNAIAQTYVDANIGLDTGNNNIAFSGNVGYMFSRYIGLEGGIAATNNYFLYDGAVKGVLPLGGIVDLYAKAGVGINNYNGIFSNSSVGLYYGGGVAFNVAHNWELHVEDFTVSGPNPNLLMFGAQYKF